MRQCVDRLVQSLHDANRTNYRIHIVIDGPIQETIAAASLIKNSRVATTVLQMNRGKGFAIRYGFSEADEDYIAFIDGDLDIHPEVLIHGLTLLEHPDNRTVGCAYGSKHHPSSSVNYPLIRRVLSGGFRFLVQICIGVKVYDTQTGAKVFRSEALKQSLSSVEEDGFLFDVELLARLCRNGWELKPLPVAVNFQYSSTIRTAEVLRMLLGTMRLSRRLRKP